MQKLLMLGSLLLLVACGGGTVDAQGDAAGKQNVAPAAAAVDKVAGEQVAGEKAGGCCSDKADACCSKGSAAPAAACCADEKAAVPAEGAAKKDGCEESCAGSCGACPPESQPTPVAPQ